jgi:phage terminase large subunit GpA-like protein
MKASLARQTVRKAMARGLRPDPRMSVADWAVRDRRLASEQSAYPGPWRHEMAPYLVEIMECLSPTHPAERVTFIKSAQVGASAVLENFIGHAICTAPAPFLVVHPTLDAALDWVTEKLEPTIEVTPALKERVAAQVSRDRRGSTARRKRFPGGWLRASGANSARSLRQSSVRYLAKDDWDEWPFELAGQGDPDTMAEARTISYRKTGLVKIFEASTPRLKTNSRVLAAYERSDKRKFYIPCPHCDEEQPLSWENLKWTEGDPSTAHFVCRINGCIIEEHHKPQMLNAGRWIAEAPGPNRHPGFWIWSAYSRFVAWSHIVTEWLKAQGDPEKLKAFHNLWRGEAWEDRGDAPAWEALLENRLSYKLGELPEGAALITAGVDVQKDRLYFEVVAWGEALRSWSIDFGVVFGDTGGDAVWSDLSERLSRKYRATGGKLWPIDIVAIDAGFNTDRVYDFVRRNSRRYATKGVGGPLAPNLGSPAKMQVTATGKKWRRGLQSWPVGTWPLKIELYNRLRQKPKNGEYPSRFCFFSADHDEAFFKQLTSESLVRHERGGRVVSEWIVSGQNHWLDCRVMAMAMLELYGAAALSRDAWSALAFSRHAPAPAAQADLGELWNRPMPDTTADEIEQSTEQTASTSPAPATRTDWIGDTSSYWD